MSSAAAGRQPRLRGRPRPHLPAGRPRRRGRRAARRRRTPPRRCRRFVRHLAEQRERGRAGRRRPAGDGDGPASADASTSQPMPGTDLRPGQRPDCTCSIAEGLRRRRLRRRAHHGLRRRARVGEPVVARARRAVTGVPAASCGRPRAARGRGPGARRPGAYVLTGRGVEQHDQGHRQACRPPSTWRSRSGLPGRRGHRLRLADRQGNGQGGREHGQKATSCPATA